MYVYTHMCVYRVTLTQAMVLVMIHTHMATMAYAARSLMARVVAAVIARMECQVQLQVVTSS
jgi:hypothetical protein